MRPVVSFVCRAVLALGAAASCAPTRGPLRPPEPEPPRARIPLPPAREPGAPRIAWDRKSREQRIEYMGLVVFPEMKAIFQKHDPQGFRQFRCQTCHGEDMVKAGYAMPNGLLALAAADPIAAAHEHDEETTRFMVEEVAPAFGRLLGREGTEPASACAWCHAGE